jgi:hypothetical protein
MAQRARRPAVIRDWLRRNIRWRSIVYGLMIGVPFNVGYWWGSHSARAQCTAFMKQITTELRGIVQYLLVHPRH